MPGVRVTPVNGHTPGQQLVEFHTGQGVLAFVGDLIPFLSQLHVPWIMGFDLNPLLTVTEKKQFLTRAVEDGYILVFEHDPRFEAATVRFVDGRFQPAEVFTLAAGRPAPGSRRATPTDDAFPWRPRRRARTAASPNGCA